jgi:hypothetical protein
VQALLARVLDEPHRALVGLDPLIVDQLEDQIVLAQSQAVDGLGLGRIVRGAEREVDPARLKERAHPVAARLAIDVLLIVPGHRELPERLAGPPRPVAQILVEHLLPGLGVDLRGLGQHPVEVEQARGDALGQVEHAGKLPANCGKPKVEPVA